MNIKFNKIVINNFLSIGNAEIDFSDLGYVLVQGRNLNIEDNATSNGSGKSSIFEAISWVLTGETVRGVKSNVSNNKTDSGARVSIDFSIDNNQIKIVRTKDDKEMGTTLKLFVDGVDKSGKGIRDTSKILSDYFPDLTPSLIGSVIILGQNLQQRFSNNTPSGRKEVLENLSKSDFMILDLKDRISKRKQILSDKFDDLTMSLCDVKNKRDFYFDQLNDVKHEIERLSSKDDLENDILTIENDLEQKKLYLSTLKNSADERREFVQKLRDEYFDCVNKKVDVEKEFSNNKQIISSNIEKKYCDVLCGIQDRINEYTVECNILKKEIDRISSIVDVCPTCGQKMVGVEKPDTTEMEKKFSEMCEKIKKENAKYIECSDKKEKEIDESLKSITEEYDLCIKNLDNRSNDILENGKICKKGLDERESEIESLSEEINKMVSNISILKARLDNFNEKIEHLNNSKKLLSDDIDEFDKKILYITNSRNSIRDRLDVINKFTTAVSRDFRGFLLKSLIEYIDSVSKEYSMCVFDTDKISFSLNGNNIDIGYCGKSYENLSSGERQKVDIIVQFALRDMLCKCLGFRCNILVLDEIFDGLDSIGCQKVIDLISTKLSDIESIFVVTHRADLAIPYDKIILVEKDNRGISRVNDIL